MQMNTLLFKQISKTYKHFPSTNSLIRISTRGFKDPVVYNPEDENKINKMPLGAYFEDFLKRRPASTGGYIKLAKENFKKMVDHTKNEDDLKTLTYAHINFLGHRNLVPHQYIDDMLMKALELGKPELMLETIHYHQELIYHPSPDVLNAYFKHFSASFDKLKSMFEKTKGNYMLQLPKEYHAAIIDQAYENKDKKTVIDAYLDILDYKASTVGKEQLKKVYESIEYENFIDHGLHEHLVKITKEKGLENDADLQALQAVYKQKTAKEEPVIPPVEAVNTEAAEQQMNQQQ